MIADTERLLTEWFGRPVILCASGRTALKLVLELEGFDRYTDQVRVPPYLSRCVLGAITHHAFPILRGPSKGVLVYHQFGFPQITAPKRDLIVEDLAHAFYATARTGEREWVGHAAIFSLTKWFRTNGPCGGIIVATEREADAIRERITAAPELDDETYTWMAHAFRTGNGLEAAYELFYKHVRLHPSALVGMPTSIAEIREIGEQRHQRIQAFRDTVPDQPEALWTGVSVPWTIPWLAPSEALERARDALTASIYHIDVARNMNSPRYRPCLLLPAHPWQSEIDYAELLACV